MLPSSPTSRRLYLSALLSECTPLDLQFISSSIPPLLSPPPPLELPPELLLVVLEYVDHPHALLSLGLVSRRWKELVIDEKLWRGLCVRWGFGFGEDGYMKHFRRCYRKVQDWKHGGHVLSIHGLPLLSAELPTHAHAHTRSSSLSSSSSPHRPIPPPSSISASASTSISTSSRIPTPQPSTGTGTDIGVVTSFAMDTDWIVAGLASARIHVFSARTGVLARTLIGHESGVWGLCLVSASRGRQDDELGMWENGDGQEQGQRQEQGQEEAQEDDQPRYYRPERQSSPTFASEGWGQPNALVVSGGCDKVVRIWDVLSGNCIYTLQGHTSTIRCMRTLHGRPIAVTGSRDGTLRTWNIRDGAAVRVLRGHTSSVRCLDVNGRRVVSGSYDATCRMWDLDTGECLHVLSGHYHQVYTVAFDGVRVATGGLDTSVRVWDAETGHCLALLQEHTALVCMLQLSRSLGILVTGGSDGKVVAFSVDGDTSVGVSGGEGGGGGWEGMFDFKWGRTAGRRWRVRERKQRGKGKGKGKGKQKREQKGDRNGSAVSLSMYAASSSACARASALSVTTNPSRSSSRTSVIFSSSNSNSTSDSNSDSDLTSDSSSSDSEPSSSPSLPNSTRPRHNHNHNHNSKSKSKSLHPFPQPYTPLYRLAAHTSSVTTLQFDGRFLVTGGNDGCVHVWEAGTGRWVRGLEGWGAGVMSGDGEGLGEDASTDGGVSREGRRDKGRGGGGGGGADGLWRVGFVGGFETYGLERGDESMPTVDVDMDVFVIAGRREGKTLLEIWGFGEAGGASARLGE